MKELDVDELLKCNKCGSIFFDEIRPKIYNDGRFIFHAVSSGSKLEFEDSTIPVAKCIFCGNIQLPRTSFAGRNILDKSVQLYAKLIEYVNAQNIPDTSKDIDTEVNADTGKQETEVGEVANVQTERDSLSSTEDAVQGSKTGSKSRKNNKVTNP